MLTRAHAIALGVCIVLLGIVTPNPQAAAECEYIGKVWMCSQVGQLPGAPGDGDSGSGSQNSGGNEEATVCMNGSSEVACTSSAGVWSSSHQCYLKVSPTQDRDLPLWMGRTEGAIYDCTSAIGGLMVTASSYQIWLATAPTLPPPDPEVLARRAIASINFRGIDLGIAPEPLETSPNSLGAVGLPVWLWSDSTGPNVTGPVSASASERGFTVTVQATMTKIEWSLGDGSPSFSCGIGQRFDPRTMNPDTPVVCGSQRGYQKQGEYQITATSNWQVQWSGIGESGTIPIQAVSAGTVRIGEIQVVVKDS